jgi:hypothetical protein
LFSIMIGYGNSMFLATHGILARSASGGGVDPDAQAFITAAAITDPTQQAAINTLVVDLKGYSIWTKFSALYPMVGGTASTHKFNLKDPRDLDAAFRLVFNGGWTHSSTGATPNGTNAFADTKLNERNVLTINDKHISIYSRTNVDSLMCDIGVAVASETLIYSKFNNTFYPRINNQYNNGISNNVSSLGHFIASRLSSTTIKAYRNNNISTITNATDNDNNASFTLSARNTGTSQAYFSSRQLSFASIGDGLTDTEAANFYTAVQAFQTTLGRSIGTQTVSDADAQAFVTAADIQDQVEANAINTLVIGMKADGLWSKMKAVYPFVGGTASTNKFNLKDPRDLDAAFRLVFSGGNTHSITGWLPNGTNGFGDTKINAFNNLSLNSMHLSVYSRTNTSGDKRDIGAHANLEGSAMILNLGGLAYYKINSTIGNYLTVANSDTRGLFVSNRTASNVLNGWKNGTKVGTGTNASTSLLNAPIYIGAIWENSAASYFANREYAFASIGDGLSDTDATNLNSRVTTFQTALNRNI